MPHQPIASGSTAQPAARRPDPTAEHAAICLPTPDGLIGRAHHQDGHPAALGVTLARLYTETFDGDLARMATVLLHTHPAGWVTLVRADHRVHTETALTRPDHIADLRRPRCYCHGGWPATTHTVVCSAPRCAGTGCTPRLTRWIYALHPDGIGVHVTNPGTGRHRLLGRRPWHDLPGIRAFGADRAPWAPPPPATGRTPEGTRP